MQKKYIFIAILILIMEMAQTVQARTLLKRTNIGVKNKVRIEELVYNSGSLRVKGRLYLPSSRSEKLPLVIFNHDGCSGITSSHEWGCIRLATQGYAVIAPSFRGEDGSEGTIEIAKGEVDDVLNIWPWLNKIENIDSQRVVLMGASHGALVSLLACKRQPNIRGLVFAYGVADIYGWWDYLASHNMIGKDIITRRTYGRGPLDRPKSFAIRHGLSAVPSVKCPTLIIQGEQDTTVPASQGKTLHRALKKAGIDSTLKLYPHGGHGLLTFVPCNSERFAAEEVLEAEEAWQDILEFLNRVMKT